MQKRTLTLQLRRLESTVLDLPFLTERNLLVSVALKASKYGREAQPSIIQICIPSNVRKILFEKRDLWKKKVFIFDVSLPGMLECALEVGLKWILESPLIIKVFHDCRFDRFDVNENTRLLIVSDFLFHRGGVSLARVWDSQLAYATFGNFAYFSLNLF